MKKTLNLSLSIVLLLSLGIACSRNAPDGNTGVMDYYKSSEDQEYLSNITTEEAPANYSYNIAQPAEETEAPYRTPNDGDLVEPEQNTEDYDKIHENPFTNATQTPVSTFSIDVDNASYSNVRRFLDGNSLPPANSIRIEEMINYFTYDYPQPQSNHPFSINTEIAPSPWNDNHHLIHIGLQGKSLDYDQLKPSNLVFLIDASGSMSDDNKLPLLKKSLKLLLQELSDQDRIAIVAYAGAAGLVLPSTPATETTTIIGALDDLSAGGSTAGGEGIQLAYKIAKEALIDGGNNRVILATDGDFNVGTSSTGDLVDLIEEKRKDDIYLTICGFGMGNYKDGRMEQISNAGNGNYFYIDNIREAQKVFVKEMRANMFTIAKDVKIQIEFTPNTIKAYRLIGYENRLLAKEDFNDDTKDAGELGAGHTVTAIYEVILSDSKSKQAIASTDELKYQKTVASSNQTDLMTVKFRYKPPQSSTSVLLEQVLTKSQIISLEQSSNNFRFSAAVAGTGMLLRDSEFKGTASYDMTIDLAKNALGKDEEGYRQEFIQLIKTAQLLVQ